jgi:hypothetical protein
LDYFFDITNPAIGAENFAELSDRHFFKTLFLSSQPLGLSNQAMQEWFNPATSESWREAIPL